MKIGAEVGHYDPVIGKLENGRDSGDHGSVAVQRILALVVILVPLIALKIWFRPGLGVGTDDGNFYYHLARHVSAGDGLVTSVSLYHQDLAPLPQRSTIYPLWPIALGLIGRAIGLPLAAHLLPEILFVADLILLYVLLSRIERRLNGQDSVFTPAHAAVAILGTSPVFFGYTSAPFGDALGFLFLFLSLLAVDESIERRGWVWPFVAGMLSGLAYLTRYQMLMLGAAVVASYGLLAIRHLDARRATVAAAAGLAVLIVPWWIYLASIVPRFVPALIMDFAAPTQRSNVRPMHWMVETDGIGGLVLDRLRGLLVAFAPVGEDSYLASFSIAALLVPLALLLALIGCRARFQRRPAGERLSLLAVVLATAFLLLPVHLIHQRMFTPWLFGRRHGLYFVLLIALALLWLVHLPQKIVRWSAVVVVIVACGSGVLGILKLASSDWPYRPTSAMLTLAAWIDSRPSPPLVLSTDPQLLSVLSQARFHWVACVDSAADRAGMIRDLKIDYVVVFPRDRNCSFMSDSALALRTVRTFGSGREEIRLMEPAR